MSDNPSDVRPDVQPPGDPTDERARFHQRPAKPDGFDAVPDFWSGCATSNDGWRALGVSIRGLSHQSGGRYRDDAVAIEAFGSWLVCAVGDGAGSHSLSRLGARAATSAATTAIIAGLEKRDGVLSNAELFDLLKVGFAAAYAAMPAYASELQQDLRDLSTTLLLALHEHTSAGRQRVATAQVGDGIIGAFARRSGDMNNASDASPLEFLELAMPDEGPFGGGTTFLNRLSADELSKRLRVVNLPTETVGVMLMTDGISDDFKPHDIWLWRLMEFCEQNVTPVADVNEALEKLQATISYERKGSFDDRTLVLIHPPQEA